VKKPVSKFAFQVHNLQRYIVGPGLDDSSCGGSAAACALDLSVPLSQVTIRPSGGGWRLETSGWHLTYHDGVSSAAEPSHPSNDVIPGGSQQRGGGGGGGGGGGRRELDAQSSSRVMTVENGAVDSHPAAAAATGSQKNTAVTADGLSVSWSPDAHFLLQEVAAAGSRVAASRAARRKNTSAAVPGEAACTVKPAEAAGAASGGAASAGAAAASASSSSKVSLDISWLSLQANVTPGAAVEITAAALTASDATKSLELTSPALLINGRVGTFHHVIICSQNTFN
jgi:hypothetical protein